MSQTWPPSEILAMQGSVQESDGTNRMYYVRADEESYSLVVQRQNPPGTLVDETDMLIIHDDHIEWYGVPIWFTGAQDKQALVFDGTAFRPTTIGTVITVANQAALPAQVPTGQLAVTTDSGTTWAYIGSGYWRPCGFIYCHSSARPLTDALPLGSQILEVNNNRVYQWDGINWRYQYGGTNPTVALAYLDAAWNISSVGSTWYQVQLDAVKDNPGGCWSIAGRNYTALEDGLYQVTGSITVGTMAQGDRIITSLYKNGAEMMRLTDVMNGPTSGTINAAGIGFGGTFSLDSGDVVDLRARQTNGTTPRQIVGDVGGITTHIEFRKVGN